MNITSKINLSLASYRLLPLLLILTVGLVVGCSQQSETVQQASSVDSDIDAAYKSQNYPLMLHLADSFGKTGRISEASAYFWQGYASDRLKQKKASEFYWQKAMAAVTDFENASEMTIYVKTASRLTNLLAVKGDFDGAMKVALPVTKKMKSLGNDTTGDYFNLLMFIGCCQTRFGKSEEAKKECYEPAYEGHLERIERNPTDAAYKDFIAGIINVTYNLMAAECYEDALEWDDRFLAILQQYEMQPYANANYVDKQKARLYIYRATILEGLGKKQEAIEAYKTFAATSFSKSSEGRFDAGDYLMAANRWREAADNYKGLNQLVSEYNVENSFDNYQKLFLKQYRAYKGAGMNDAAITVSMGICDSLDAAIDRAKKDDAAELSTIYETQQKESRIAQQQADMSTQRLVSTLVALSLIIVFMSVYAINRRRSTRRLKKAHEELKQAYDQLEETTSAKERIESELRIARDIQMSLVPNDFPQRDDVELYAAMTPAKEVGGDLYDYLLQDKHLYFCVADVSGKGVPASLFMAQAIRLFRALAKEQKMPAEICQQLNNELCENNENGMFVTMFIGLVDLQTGHLDFCNAGHNQPVLGNGEESAFIEMESNAPIGLWPDLEYVGEQIDTIKNRFFFVYTDGLNEAENMRQEQFGDDHLLAILQQMHFSSAYQVVTVMKKEVEHHRDGTDPNDDLTIFCMMVKGQPA